MKIIPYFWVLFSASLVLFSAGLLTIHIIWVCSQEFGVKRAGGIAQYKDAIIFGLYACGWDLLTSPAGLLLAAIYRSLFAGLPLIRTASRAPKLATAAHLEKRRGLSAEERKSAFFWSLLLTGGTVLFAGFLLFILLLTLMFIYLMAI